MRPVIPHRASLLYDLLAPFAHRNIVAPFAASCEGSVSRFLGLLASAISRWEAAERHFEDALEMNARMGARPFVARTQRDYAAMLLARDRRGDRARAFALLAQALTTARELGMTEVVERVRGLQRRATGTAVGERRIEGDSPAADNVFRHEGHYWTIAYGGRAYRLKDAKGLRDIATLLRQPGSPVPATELVAPTEPATATTTAAEERARLIVRKRIKAALDHIASADPDLARYLAANIKTGARCTYAPAPEHVVSWAL